MVDQRPIMVRTVRGGQDEAEKGWLPCEAPLFVCVFVVLCSCVMSGKLPLVMSVKLVWVEHLWLCGRVGVEEVEFSERATDGSEVR